jgi:hypothetical protein
MYTETAVIIGITAVNLLHGPHLSSVIEGVDRSVERRRFNLGAGPVASSAGARPARDAGISRARS